MQPNIYIVVLKTFLWHYSNAKTTEGEIFESLNSLHTSFIHSEMQIGKSCN